MRDYNTDDNGHIQGTYRNRHSDGQLQDQCEYVNDKRHGTYQAWYKNGQLWVQCEYVNGDLHGTYKRWYENGQLMEQEEWINGNRHGIRYIWYKNGQLMEQNEYVNGELHGFSHQWDEEDGLLDYIQQNNNGNLLVQVNYYTTRVEINICEANVESTVFLSNLITNLIAEKRSYKINHINP